MPKRSRCRWCGYVLPEEQRACAPRGRHSDRYGSAYCRDNRDRFVRQAAGMNGNGELRLDDSAIEVVDHLHRLRESGLKPDEIVAVMRERGIAPVGHSRAWSRYAVCRLLALRREYYERLRYLTAEAYATQG